MRTISYTCDICGESMNREPDNIITIVSNHGAPKKTYEICDKDYMKLDSFLRFNENWNNDGGVINALERART